jgi:DNA-binding protein HU-beta
MSRRAAGKLAVVRTEDRARTTPQGLTRLAKRTGLPKLGLAGQWALLLHLAIEETTTSGQFLLPGIGKVVLDRRTARKGRNPQTGQPIIIPPKTTLRFRFLKTFKEAVLPTATPDNRRSREKIQKTVKPPRPRRRTG